MSRIIKFRAWDNGVMHQWNELQHTPPSGWDTERIPHMQFTGLIDKNGKEIYEGDILRISDNLIEEVKWVDDSNWNGDCTVIGFVNHVAIYHKGPEVIGNIYENPNLLSV